MSYTVQDLDNAVGAWASTLTQTANYLSPGNYDADESRVWGELKQYLSWKDHKFILLPGIGELTLVKVVGGGEGGGEDYHLILRVTSDHGVVRTFKRNGWYASYDGGYLEGPTQEGKIVIKPVEVFE